MVNCSFCDNELPRHVFCNASHKVLFHRNKLTNSKQDLPKVNNPPNNLPKVNTDLPKVNEDKIIYHGTWLCKKHQSFVCSCKQPTEKT